MGKKPETTPPRRAALIFAGLLLAACAAPEKAPLPRLAPEAERIFHADPRWLGGDAAISVDLGDDRVLWLFGDSFVDPSAPYLRREAAFPRNTVAIQHGRDPATARMDFAWRRDGQGLPSAYFPAPGDDWYWPGDGVRLPGGVLAIFLHRLRATDDAPPLGFESAGYAVALIDNPDEPPESWAGRIVPGPPLPFDAVPGAALVLEGETVTVLAVGGGETPQGMLVRYDARDIASGDLARGLWWSGADFVPVAALGTDGPAAVMTDPGAESSLQATACGYLHVASRGFGATEIVARTARRLTGPWSAPVALLRPPDSDGPGAFVYAGRGHAELPAPAAAFTVSWAANDFTPEALLTPDGQRRLYWPRLAYVPAPPCPE